jgi:hypothetical protein
VAAETRIEHQIGAQSGSRRTDAVIAWFAERQHRVVSREQLRNAGVHRRAIQRRIDAKRLFVIHRGVYAVGSRRLGAEGRLFAAVLAGGAGANVCGQSAGAHFGFTRDDRANVHIAARTTRTRKGIRFHELDLRRNEVTTSRGIPITTPARTLLDCATTLNQAQLEQALREALYHQQTSLPALRRLLRSHPGHRGAGALGAAIRATEDAPGITRSGLERWFQRFLRKHGFPPPELNVPMRLGELEIEADCYWAEHRLIVELDHRSTHARRKDFAKDRRRDRAATTAGIRIVRVADEDRAGEAGLAADLATLLAVAVPA